MSGHPSRSLALGVALLAVGGALAWLWPGGVAVAAVAGAMGATHVVWGVRRAVR